MHLPLTRDRVTPSDSDLGGAGLDAVGAPLRVAEAEADARRFISVSAMWLVGAVSSEPLARWLRALLASRSS